MQRTKQVAVGIGQYDYFPRYLLWLIVVWGDLFLAHDSKAKYNQGNNPKDSDSLAAFKLLVSSYI